jgi:hypothetical protein
MLEKGMLDFQLKCIQEVDEHHPTKSINVMTDGEKLSSACFGMVIRNSCKQVI